MTTSQLQTVPVPAVIKNLIESNNRLLQNYQDELQAQVISANIELMMLLGLDPKDGWRIDVDAMVYVKDVPSEKKQTDE